MFFKKTAISMASLALVMPIANAAQDNAEFNPVVVSAARFEQRLSDVIPSATVINREEIERAQAPTLVDLIQGQPGIEIGRNGGPGTTSSIFMRGQASSNVAVFIDGIPVQRDAYGGLKLVDIPPSQIEKIEILRGNMGAVYGESAVGGAIHIYTRSGVAASGPTASASYGSRNTSDLTAGYNLKGDDYKLGFSVQRFNTDGYSAMNPSQNPTTVNPDKDGFKRESVFLNGEKRVSQDLAIGFQANSIDSKVNYDSTSNPFTWGSASPADQQNSKQKSSDLTFYSRLNLSSDWSSRIAITESNFENRDYYNGAANGSYDGDQLGIQWGNTYKIGTGNASFGVDATNAEFKTPTKYERDSLGYYLGYSGQLDRLDYQANVRRDEIKSEEGNTSKNNSANTWLLGGGYSVTDSTKLIGLQSTSFRAPAVAELFGRYGNPNLQPQEHKGRELGFQHKNTFGLLRAVYFTTETKNDFGYGSDWKPYNIAKTENKGYELSLNGNAEGWGYKLSAVSQDPKNAESGARLARRAKEYASVDLTKNALGIDWGTKVLWSGNRKDSDYNNYYNSSYTVVNLTAAKRLTSEWIARLKVENAFDKKYQLAYGYDAVPRGVFLSVQYQPK